MLLRPILSRIRKHQGAANLCILNNGGTALLRPENAPSPSPSKEKPLEKGYVISYLVKSCGLSAENAVSASRRVHFDSPDKPNAVLKFLEKQGFSKTQIADLVRRQPPILAANPEKTLLPKIEFLLQSVGISEKDVCSTLSKYPNFLFRSLHQLASVYDYLVDLMGALKARTLVMRGSWIFRHHLENRLTTNIDFLRNLGVPVKFVEYALFQSPDMFWPRHDEFVEVVEEVKQMGFDPMKSMFILAINARTGKGNLSSWDECYEAYVKWGWSKDDILMAFKKHPNCMVWSERKISKVLGFLVFEMGLESRSVARCPYVIFYSMEKRIVPRCAVIRVLSSKGLVKKDWSLTCLLCPAESVFLQKYVTKYAEEVPQLYDIYQRNVGSLTLKSSEEG